MWALGAEIGGVLSVVTCCASRVMPTCSPVIGRFFYAVIVASIDEEW